VIWRFTGSRVHSEGAERRAQCGVALSFWLLVPYVAADSVLGRAKHRLAAQLGSAATTGEGTQSLLCAASAVAVLLGLAVNAALGWWWLDACAGLAVAAAAIKEGRDVRRGHDCC